VRLEKLTMDITQPIVVRVEHKLLEVLEQLKEVQPVH
jgi:hypothetical protein